MRRRSAEASAATADKAPTTVNLMRRSFISTSPCSAEENSRVNAAGAVADLVAASAQLIEQSKMQICQRDIPEPDVTASFQIARPTSRQNHGDVVRRVAVAVSNAGTVDDRRMIEERALP